MSTWQLYTMGSAADLLAAGGAASSLVSSLTGQGWSPPQWSGFDQSQLVMVRTNMGGYFFDAMIRANHGTRVQITEHPIETGANISDHAYKIPARLEFEIGMSDSMATLAMGQYSGGSSKSVNAYQTFVQMQYARTPMTVVTRLNTYTNMLIESVDARDDHTTAYALKATITLREIMLAVVSTTTVPASSKAQSVSQTKAGNVAPSADSYNSTIIGSSGGASSGSITNDAAVSAQLGYE